MTLRHICPWDSSPVAATNPIGCDKEVKIGRMSKIQLSPYVNLAGRASEA
jgi:hypothetical protein